MQILWPLIFGEIVMMLDHALAALQQAREQSRHSRMASQRGIVDVPNSWGWPIIYGIETVIEMQLVGAVRCIIQGGDGCMTFTEIGSLGTQHAVTPAKLRKGATLLLQHLRHPSTAQVVVNKEVSHRQSRQSRAQEKFSLERDIVVVEVRLIAQLFCSGLR